MLDTRMSGIPWRYRVLAGPVGTRCWRLGGNVALLIVSRNRLVLDNDYKGNNVALLPYVVIEN